MRPGDSGARSTLASASQDLAPLSEERTPPSKPAAEEERALQRELREAEELIASEPTVWPSFLSTIAGALLVGACGMVWNCSVQP